tara:strand:- start:457 stop:663 length:207 start_codon:yes stop_codon:yes gene_type:complete
MVMTKKQIKEKKMHLIDKILNDPKEMKRIEINSLNQKLGYWRRKEEEAKKHIKKYEEKIKQIEKGEIK